MGRGTEMMATSYDTYIQAEVAKLEMFAKPDWYDQTLADLARHEGYREFAYPDPLSFIGRKFKSQKWGYRPAEEILAELHIPHSDWGKGAPWTVGFGETKGITPLHRMELNVAKRRLAKSMMEHSVELGFVLPEWKTYPVVVKGVLVNLIYNMGRGTLATFKTTLGMIKARKFATAGVNLKKSLWYKQVKGRAVELVNRLVTGEIDPDHQI